MGKVDGTAIHMASEDLKTTRHFVLQVS
jgi:hypothetical protein